MLISAEIIESCSTLHPLFAVRSCVCSTIASLSFCHCHYNRGPKNMGATANGLSCQFCFLCCLLSVLVSSENSWQPSNGTVAIMVLPSGNTTWNFSPFFRLPFGTLIFWTRWLGGGCCGWCGCRRGSRVFPCGGIWTRIAEPGGHSFGTTAEIFLPSGVWTRTLRSGPRFGGTITFTVAADWDISFMLVIVVIAISLSIVLFLFLLLYSLFQFILIFIRTENSKNTKTYIIGMTQNWDVNYPFFFVRRNKQGAQ